MERVIYGDCRDLVENFITKGKPTFESFIEVWKAKKFIVIYAPLTTNIEVIQMTSTIINAAKRFICGKETGWDGSTKDVDKLLPRIGGLYLLYLIYFKQPTQHYVKAEFSLESWKELRNFIGKLPATKNYEDPRYIFWKLHKENAFRFTALNYTVGLDSLTDYDKVAESEDFVELEGGPSKLERQLPIYSKTKKLVPALVVLEDAYNEMKSKLNESSDSKIDNIPPITIANHLKNTFGKLEIMLRKVEKQSDSGEKEKQETQEVPEVSAESKKRSLKRKARQTDLKNSTSPAAKNVSTGRRAQRYAPASVFNMPLSDNLRRELEDSDDEDKDSVTEENDHDADGNLVKQENDKAEAQGQELEDSDDEDKDSVTEETDDDDGGDTDGNLVKRENDNAEAQDQESEDSDDEDKDSVTEENDDDDDTDGNFVKQENDEAESA